MRERYDVIVVGAGIVGLATARAVTDRRPTARVAVLDKEPAVARHQTGRNSGVLHSGIYYRPGTWKATASTEGRRTLERYCAEAGVPFERCGKLIVAADPRELPRLAVLEERARANGVTATRLDAAGIRRHEPHVRGVAALHVAETGVVDFGEVARALASDLVARGVELRLGVGVQSLREAAAEVVVTTSREDFAASQLVNCAGLHADVLAAGALGPVPDVRIVPFRGEYHELVGESARLVRHLVYPVPDPGLPFLGVHVSRGIGGHVHAGPNAVLALRREGYTWRDADLRELVALAGYPGVWRMARRWWAVGAAEVVRSASRAATARSIRRLVPDVTADDLVPAPAGVRAQAVGRDGVLNDDFVVRTTGRAVHVLNAPSPGATASLAIGASIAQRLDDLP